VHLNVESSKTSRQSINASASYSYIASLASSVQALDESLNDERKLLLISQHQHHSSVAKIAELERTVEHLQAQWQRSEGVNRRIMERTQELESALHAWTFQKMTNDSELHSTHQLVCIAT
jgi:PHD/YefM family antitoxin component YafN of YafNO toxin-antitoxin module